MRRFDKIALLVGAVLAAAGADTALGLAQGAEPEERTLRVTYIATEGFTALDELFNAIVPDFEANHPGVTIELEPISASDADYATRVALAQQSDETAPDIVYEDTFQVRSDVAAGYLLNLDPYLAGWEDWEQFNDGARSAGQGDDGSVYAVSLGTDTRGIWYNKAVLEAAGIELPWQPATWEDILTAAEQIKASNPDVVPFHIYAGTPAGEGSVMQGFLPLLYGTGSRLYDDAEQKWVVGSQGFVDALTFLASLYEDGYAVEPSQALDANLWQSIIGEWLPGGGIGGTLEGSYLPSFWQEGGSFPWAEYADGVGVAAFPTQTGQAPGRVSFSGGWTLAIGARTDHPDLAFEFLATALNKDNALAYAISNSQIAVRNDVAAEPSYLEANPFVGFFTELVTVTHFRPATADYPRISSEIQIATEAVITGNATPEEAAAAYDDAVRDIVGEDNTIES